MKSIGIIRKVDEFGRIVIPIELRRSLGIGIKGSIELLVDGQNVILRRYTAGCSHCGCSGTAFKLGNVTLCETCRDSYAGFAVGYFRGEPKDSSSFPFVNKIGRKNGH